jgi:hypothetical protein
VSALQANVGRHEELAQENAEAVAALQLKVQLADEQNDRLIEAGRRLQNKLHDDVGSSCTWWLDVHA